MTKLTPYFAIFSSLLIATSLFSLVKFGFKPSIDFVGGTVWQLTGSGLDSQSEAIQQVFSSRSLHLERFQINGQQLSLRFESISPNLKPEIEADLRQLVPDLSEVRFETIGASLSQELIIKTIVAIVLSSITILIYIARRFGDITFGLGAIIATLHDALILLGAFSLLGKLFDAPLDALFVTALLTTISASVHDTVVTFDRIRELRLHTASPDWSRLTTQAVRETLVRSLNNSITIILMLLSLVLLGGPTTRWFATALLIGVISGTYSSIGVAIPVVLFLKRKK